MAEEDVVTQHTRATLNSLMQGVSSISRSNCQASAETLSAITRSRNVKHQPTSYKTLVLLRESLSNQNSPFVKLMKYMRGDPPGGEMSALPQVNTVDLQRYRQNRMLSPAQRAKLAEEYRVGLSALELARKYKTHRHTVARHLEREGVAIRPQKKMTPRLVARAEQLYEEGNSLTEVGRQLGLEASTVGKALKRAGVKLRPPVADRWHASHDDES